MVVSYGGGGDGGYGDSGDGGNFGAELVSVFLYFLSRRCTQQHAASQGLSGCGTTCHRKLPADTLVRLLHGEERATGACRHWCRDERCRPARGLASIRENDKR